MVVSEDINLKECCGVLQDDKVLFVRSRHAKLAPEWLRPENKQFRVCGDISEGGTLTVCKKCAVRFGLVW